MDTDLLDINSEAAVVDNGELYSDVNALARSGAAPSSSVTTTPNTDRVEQSSTLQTTNPQSAVPKLDPPAPHAAAAQSTHYKSPATSNDGGSTPVVVKSAPQIPPRPYPAVPTVPPRKPRMDFPTVAGRSETIPAKTTQELPPLPRFTTVAGTSATAGNSTGDCFANQMYDSTMAEASANQCPVKVDGSSIVPPLPVPRNTAGGISAHARVPPSNPRKVLSDSPAPCTGHSSGEQVS